MRTHKKTISIQSQTRGTESAATESKTRDLLPSTCNSSASKRRRKIRRNGRIACLPKIERDMVNRMLWNAVPYKNIVLALHELDFTVTERNISNWATGGYLEWKLEQEDVLQYRLDQDRLLDFLRRDDAAELPEVGLQAAATRLSQVLLQKLSQADDPESHLETYSKLIDLLCRLNREIAATQKLRDDSRRTLGPEYDPAVVKDVDQLSVIENERFYSDPPDDANLEKPPTPPGVPPIPTASFLAQMAEEELHDEQIDRAKHNFEILQAHLDAHNPPDDEQDQPPSPSDPNESKAPDSQTDAGQQPLEALQ